MIYEYEVGHWLPLRRPKHQRLIGGRLRMLPQDSKKVLVLEDEVIVALDLAETIRGAGYEVIGPYYSEEKALDALENSEPAFALLDVNLGQGADSLKVARRLDEIGSKFAFLTGYDASGLKIFNEFESAKLLSKPLDTRHLINWLDGH